MKSLLEQNNIECKNIINICYIYKTYQPAFLIVIIRKKKLKGEKIKQHVVPLNSIQWLLMA